MEKLKHILFGGALAIPEKRRRNVLDRSSDSCRQPKANLDTQHDASVLFISFILLLIKRAQHIKLLKPKAIGGCTLKSGCLPYARKNGSFLMICGKCYYQAPLLLGYILFNVVPKTSVLHPTNLVTKLLSTPTNNAAAVTLQNDTTPASYTMPPNKPTKTGTSDSIDTFAFNHDESMLLWALIGQMHLLDRVKGVNFEAVQAAVKSSTADAAKQRWYGICTRMKVRGLPLPELVAKEPKEKKPKNSKGKPLVDSDEKEHLEQPKKENNKGNGSSQPSKQIESDEEKSDGVDNLKSEANEEEQVQDDEEHDDPLSDNKESSIA